MLESLVFAIVALLVVFNPVTIAIYFLTLSEGKGEADCRRMAVRASLIAASIAAGAIVIGEPLLDVLGVRLSSFRIAGGLILGVFGIRSGLGISRGFVGSAEDPASIPLASPLMAGPGMISMSILLGDEVGVPITLFAIVLMVLLALACMLSSRKIARIIGNDGAAVISRVMGLVLVAVSVQFILAGFTEGAVTA